MSDLWHNNNEEEVNPEAVKAFLQKSIQDEKTEIEAYRELMAALEIDVEKLNWQDKEKQKQTAHSI